MSGDAEAQARAFVAALEERAAPLEHAYAQAAWDAATGGGEAAGERSARARAALKALFSDADDAGRVRGWLAPGAVADAGLRRQLVLLDLEYTRNQLPRETIDRLVDQAAELEQTFYGFRAELRGERVPNNRILDILSTATDEGARREAWAASKQIGAQVAAPLREHVATRNEAARALGFRDAYAMDLHLQEIDEDALFRTLDDFRDRTDAPFRALRAEMDAQLAARFGVDEDALRPWHWEDPFAQEAPALGGTDLDALFRDREPVSIATRFFKGLGLPVEAVLERSDLYEREGKDQHAFCTDIDRRGDVRILCNLRDDEKWMSTLLHELGHAVYDAGLPASLPYFVRQPAHTLSTESVAMFFGRMTRDGAWLREVMGARVDEAGERGIRAQLRASLLIAMRWMLVMVYFERELHRDPARADLNAVWWSLVERMQCIRHPEADPEGTEWASKIHLSLSPVYYHNYLLGELMASQVSATLRREAGVEAGRSVAGRAEVGAFFRERIFAPGASMDWNELLVHATGEALSPRFFVEEFVDG